MIPVDQTTVGDAGNCLAASVASVCHLGLAAVPDLRGDQWWPILASWLHQFGWAPLYLETLPASFTGYCLGLGEGPRGLLHAVVWVGGPGGGIAHDPHPSRAGLVSWPHAYVLFVPLNPGQRVTR